MVPANPYTNGHSVSVCSSSGCYYQLILRFHSYLFSAAISTIYESEKFIMSDILQTSYHTYPSRMAKIGFLTGMYPQWFEYASVMAYDRKDPPCGWLWFAPLIAVPALVYESSCSWYSTLGSFLGDCFTIC